MKEWYEIANVKEIDSPAFLIFPDRVRRNITKVIEEAGGARRLRPHVKTHKNKEIAQMMLDAGIHKFKCATIAEAEMLAMAGAKDILIAYQLNEAKALRFTALIKKYGNSFSCLVDNSDTLELYSRLARETGVTIPVYMDLDVGMNRTGIAPGKKAVELYVLADSSAAVEIRGMHAYDGHIHVKDFDERTRVCDDTFRQVEDLREELTKMGYKKVTVVAGGSLTFPIHAKRADIELSPGTFVFWDYGYRQMIPEQTFEYAALVLTRVISIPEPGMICIDLGYKSIASENELNKRVYFLNAPDLTPVAQSEEHLALKVIGDHVFKVGDVLYGVPYHVCPTCALYESASVIENGMKAGDWKIIARDRKLTI